MKPAKLSILAIVAAVLSLLGGVAVAADAEGYYTVYGYGIKSCATILEGYRKDNFVYNAVENWVSSYMSAAGEENDTQKPFGDVADFAGFMHLIRAYCEENPLDNLADAADYVVEVHLLPKAGYR